MQEGDWTAENIYEFRIMEINWDRMGTNSGRREPDF